MTPLDVMKQLGLLGWPELLCGWKLGFISNKNISDFSVEQLAESDDLEVALLSSATSLSSDDVAQALEKIVPNVDMASCKDKWRLARLVELNHKNITDSQKLDELQLIYADFDYPEDMENCSIYSSGSEAPLVSMNKIINSLQRKYQVK